jgi:amino acid adenylation domain-containing protein
MTNSQQEVIEGFRLSPQQKYLWLLQQEDPGRPYCTQCAVLIEGNLDTKILAAALQNVFDRHEILRTTFTCLPGMSLPVQVISDGSIPSIDCYDLTGRGAAEQETRIEALFQDANLLPFDFEKGPLSRVSIVTLSPDKTMLLVTLSSLCADTASLGTLVRELSRAYSACARCEELSGEPMQYADLAEWQNELLESADTRAGREYWRKQNISNLLTLQLPFERQSSGPSHLAHFDPRFLTSTITPDTAAEIRTLTRKYDASAFAFFLACWQTLLWRLTGLSDFIVGMACDGRTYEGLQETLGPFAKYLPLHCHLKKNLQFSALLAQVNQSARDVVEWQEYFSWEQIVGSNEDIKAPLFFPASFKFAEQPAGCSAAAVKLSIHRRLACADRFKLKLSCVQREDLPTMELHYDAHLYRVEDIRRLAGQWHTLLESVVRDPEAAICGLEIVSGAERRQLLVEFNDTKSDFPEDKCIQQLFEEQVERAPDNVAVVFEDRQLTYAQLNARANQLAHYLRTLGVGPEVLVGICLERSLEMVIGLLGILKAGGAYVPLDPEYPKERLASMLEDTQAPVLLTQQRLMAELIEDRGSKPVLSPSTKLRINSAEGIEDGDSRSSIANSRIHVVCLDTEWEAIAQEGEENAVSSATARNAAYVIYTSGSTGQPKGVMIEHCGLSNTLNWLSDILELSTQDRCLLKTPITFDAAGREIFPTLIAGGCLVIAEANGHRDCRYIADIIRNEGISIFHCVPSFLWLLMEEPALDGAAALRAVMCGGEALLPQVVMRFRHRSGAKLYNVYGPTEAIIDSTYWLCEGTGAHSTIPIGRPIPNARMYILDEALRPLPLGVPGNLYIGGVSLARGYLDRPELTAEKFVPNPFSEEPGARLYKTGDLARYLPDGNIEFLGRADHQVKIRGFRIELGEIEAALDQHPAVREAVALAREDTLGEKRLVAYVVVEQESRPAANDLRSFLKEKLPEHMVPALFVLLDTLPLTPNGKVDRRALPAPDRTRPELDKTFVAPRTPTEELLSEIWAQVLDIERVGIHDNFFDLGGHSLLATQVVSRIREAFQVELPLRRLFEVPTVAGLAESIEVADRAGQNLVAPPILPVPRDGNLALSFAQQRLWFIEQLAPGNSAYHIPAAIRLRGPLNLAALEQCLNQIVQRHESLRTTFAMVDGQPVQVIAPALTIELPVVDLRNLPEAERETEVRRLVTEGAMRPFDLSQGPLVRVALLRLGDEEHVGLLTMHHIVSDGWSTGILIREIARLYVAFSSGGSLSLPELPIQYADFAHWQRQWLQGEVLETQLAYWKQQLAGAPPLLDLPTDRPRPDLQTFRGAHQSLMLPKTLTEGFKALGRQEGVTQFMTLLAAFKVLLYRYTSQDDLIVGTPIANRNRLETEGLIGCFVNALVLRTDLSGNPCFRDLLRRVREVCLGAYAHQDLPFDRLVEELRLKRDLNRNPLFQVMFVLQNASARAVELPGLTLSPVEGDSETAHFDLTLVVVDADQGLTASFVYNTDLFEAATIARMLGHFQILLEAMVADPEQRLSDLPLLTDAERQQLLVEWNDTKTDYPRDLSIHQFFEAQAKRTPDAIAVVFEREQLTYGELNRRANQLAHYLRALGAGPEVPVAVCLERSLDMIIGLLGILKAGGAYVPLDQAYPQERLSLMLKDAQVPMLLTQKRLVVGLPECEARVVCLDSVWEAIASESAENPSNATRPENLAYIIYTSGSTAQPKGVLVSHGSIADHCRSAERYYELNAGDGVLQFASLSFDVSLEEILPALMVGAKLVVMGTDMWQPAEFHRKISEFGLTVLNLPSAYWQELARQWAVVPELVPNIQPRLFIVGGDTMLPDGLDLWQRTPVNSVRLLNAYGPTETTITATAFECGPLLCDNRTFQRIPIGRPLANRETYILDNYGNPVPVGVPGELHIGGVGVGRGYLNWPDLTAEKFVPNPFSEEPGARLYKTGDLARYLPDGNIEFLGRVDHQVKIRGFRIELGEIEAALDQHPAVREAVVLAPEDAPGEKRLVAYVVAERELLPTTTDLRSFLKEKLPEHMVPALFVLLDALPLMPNGKVDRRALPVPDRARPELEKAFVAPRDDLELQLAQIWEEVLGVRPVGVKDNFFELGGHSLMAVRLFALIEKRLGRKLPLTTVFQGATVEHLASVLRQQPGPQSSLVPIKPDGGKRPLFLVHPAGGHVFPYVYLAQYLDPDQPCYGLQARGLEEGQDPHTRIEDMAAYYIKALQTVQPAGPYLLGGWSMGGVVAFEMAQQLHAQGQRVALLALLDGRIPTPDETFPEEDYEAVLLVERYFGLSFGPMESLAQLPKDEQLAFMLEQAKSAGLVPAELDVSEARRFVELLKSDLRATQNYALHLYPGRVTLFKASEELAGTSPDPTLGWNEWVNAGVEVHIVPGNHANLVYEPHVQVLAEKLSACISQALSAEECLTQSQSTDPTMEEAQ